jgi:hypothetical protein
MLPAMVVPFFHTPNFVLISVGTRPNYSLRIVRSYLGASAGASQAKAHQGRSGDEAVPPHGNYHSCVIVACGLR